jgi:class 3 adenylate cyclase/pimeloyl-ACP methyl ester carboxylesterase
VSIAYQVVGEGLDLLMVPMFASHLDLMWSEPFFDRGIRELASFARVILFDMPGTGVSDRVSRILTLDERVAVIGAVLDAVGSERATIAGTSEGGQASILFAATYPERTRALILYSTYPKVWATEEEIAQLAEETGLDASPEEVRAFVHRVDELRRMAKESFDHWGEGRTLDLVATPPHSLLERRMWAVAERATMSRATARQAFQALSEFDVTDVLPAVHVPTLVMHPTNDLIVPIEAGRFLAHRIPGAKFVETSGAHHGFMFGDVVMAKEEVERFLTGTVHAWDPDRSFATVVFTDIVGSTDHAARLGDYEWRGLLERHDALVQDRVDAAGGTVVKTTGDGFLITFERATDAVRCAHDISRAADNELGIQIRAGVHSGECELMRHDLAGLAVHVGARVNALARPGEVLVSSAVKDLLAQSEIELAERGAHRLKGVPGEWQLFATQIDGAGREGAALAPAPADAVTLRDRIAVAFAYRAPGVVRTATRALRWRPRHRRLRAQADTVSA